MSTTAAPSTAVHPSARSLFRDANDRVRGLFDAADEADRIFFCECHDAFCTEPVRMTVAEYDAVCASGTYAVRPGHEDRRYDVVIGWSDSYAVVRRADAA